MRASTPSRALMIALGAVLVTGALSAGLFAPAAEAAEPDPKCVREARQDYRFCRSECREEFRADKDMCRNIDHDCADVCRAGLDDCLDGPGGPLTRLDDCREVCSLSFADARDDCRDLYGPGTPERDQCIDAVQIANFSCRDRCREGVAGDLRVCRRAFKGCIRACPPPAE